MNQLSQWWKNETSTDLISGPRLIARWEELLFGKPEPSTSQIQSLADLTQKLWRKFTTNRVELEREYMSDEKLLSAYFASFFIPNIERTRSLLMSPRISSHLKSISSKDTLHLLDFGSGPLSATLGFLLALNEMRRNSDTTDSPKTRIQITAVERSDKAVKRGESLLNSILRCAEVEVTRRTSIPKDEKFDIVLAANVFNEIPEKHRVKTLRQMFESLTDSQANLALLIEPGQFDSSKDLTSLRDAVLSADLQPTMQIIAPCPHSGPCPLSPNLARSDWCWFRTDFSPPETLKLLDAKSQIQHSSLAYSYLAWTKASRVKSELSPSGKNVWAVCISDEMPGGEFADSERRLAYYQSNLNRDSTPPPPEMLERLSRSGHKTKLCCQSSNYLGGLRLRGESQPPFLRGDELQSDNSFSAVINER